MYKMLRNILVLGAFMWPSLIAAQSGYTVCPTDQNECHVEWWDGTDIIKDALRNTIANDTDRPDGRIYVLERGGLYYNTESMSNQGFHLRLVGGPAPTDGSQDFGPPVIQMVLRDDGSVNQRMLTVGGDLTLQNVWITGQDDAGSTTAYHPIQVEANGVTIKIDRVIFERSNFAIMGVASANTRVHITNSRYRNFINTTQQWEGRIIRFEAGARELIMENNTFFNVGMTVIQSESSPIDYVRFVHNTVVNVGRTLNAGGIWKEAYFANNLVVNPFWHGEGSADYSNPNREDPVTGWFTIAPLPPAFGDELARRIVYTNSVHWRDPQFATFYGDTVRAQPLVNGLTQGRIDANDAFVLTNNQWDVNPGLFSYTNAPDGGEFPTTAFPLSELVPRMWNTINGLRQGQTTTWNEAWLWDPGRDPFVYQGAGFVYPLPENFTYSNDALKTASTNGLPLGDLNWYPEAKTQWDSNREEWIAGIEAMAGEEVVINPISIYEAESGELTGDAEVETFDGFTYFRFASGGWIQWEFEIEEQGVYDLDLWTHMQGNTTRGQRIIVNGVNVRNPQNWGEYIWDSTGANDNIWAGMPTNEWVWTRIKQEELHPSYQAAMEFQPGRNVVRIEPSWGYQSFAGLKVYPSGSDDAVHELLAPDASSAIVPEVCDGADVCPSGFQKVVMGANGGASSASWDINVPDDGRYFLKFFYQVPDGDATAQLTINGNIIEAELLFSGDAETEDFYNVSSGHLPIPRGVHRFTLSTNDKINIDYLQLLDITTTSVDRGAEVPNGYALNQNYPNPFNPSTTISFTVPTAQDVRLTVYNILGQHVATLADGFYSAGTHQLRFNAANLASGTYIYQIQTGNFVEVRKMTLIK